MIEEQPAAIRGTFADFKIIRTRKLAQIIVEVPIEEADEALRVLGGLPQPHQDQWLALARLNGVAKPEPEPKEKQKWDDLKLSMQAGIRCSEPAFWQFLAKEKGFSSAVDEESATFLVRSICGVFSRGGLNTEPEAAAKWRDLDRSYQAWLKVADA